MSIEGGYATMVDREVFDEWLRDRASDSGAVRHTGSRTNRETLASRPGASTGTPIGPKRISNEKEKADKSKGNWLYKPPIIL